MHAGALEQVPNEGSSLDEKYELLGGGPIVDYYESIDSPTVSMNITFIDIDQVISRKGISGGEMKRLSFASEVQNYTSISCSYFLLYLI